MQEGKQGTPEMMGQWHPILSVRQVIPRTGDLTGSVSSLSLPAPSQLELIWTGEMEGGISPVGRGQG